MGVEKIYIVKGSSGDYGDHRTWVVCAFTGEEAAKKFVAEISAEVVILEQRMEIECKPEGGRWSDWDINGKDSPDWLHLKLDPTLRYDSYVEYIWFETELRKVM